jgi:oligopeptide transport system ATP-binding protein
MSLVEVEGLVKHFPLRHGKGAVRAVDGVSFTIERGRTLALVGESGCGKTTVGRCLLRLVEPTQGVVRFDGQDVTAMRPRELREARRAMQLVFQDPYSSLDPRMTIRAIVAEPLLLHGATKRGDLDEAVLRRLERVGLGAEHLRRFPHELSGGQRQRVGIARALALEPRFLVLDEPTSALDVSVQSRILALLTDLQRDLGLTYLFISHDLAVVRQLADEVAVMYLGEIVERGPTEAVFTDPQHPYTMALLSAVPVPDPTQGRDRILLHGDVPSPARPPAACRFHPRCFRAQEVCALDKPALEPKGACLAACHFPGKEHEGLQRTLPEPASVEEHPEQAPKEPAPEEPSPAR